MRKILYKGTKPKRIEVVLPVMTHDLGYTYKELLKFMSNREYKKFMKWMYGQTCGVDEKGEVRYYAYDVKRFLVMVRNGGPDLWD